MNRKQQQVMHIHGGSAFDTYEQYIENLKKWSYKIDSSDRLQRWSWNYYNFLNPDTYLVIQPEMPSKQNAKYLEWKIWFEKSFEFLEDGIILVGHSLGGIFLAKYLSENSFPFTITQLHLVAPVYSHENDDEQLADFRLAKFPGTLLEKEIPEIHIYHSKDDTIVPFEESEKYHKHIPNSQLHVFEGRGHFLGEEFPELFNNIIGKE